MEFVELATKLNTQEGQLPYGGVVLSLDPGHTTGFTVFEGYHMREAGELITKELPKASDEFSRLLERVNPIDLIYEDYRVYRWKQKQHVGSELLTTKVIGCIETVCALRGGLNLQIHKQPASLAKKFCTDAKLKEWGFWVQGQKHARDAIRHACYFLLFGGRSQWRQNKRLANPVG